MHSILDSKAMHPSTWPLAPHPLPQWYAKFTKLAVKTCLFLVIFHNSYFMTDSGEAVMRTDEDSFLATDDADSYIRTDDESYMRTDEEDAELYDKDPKVSSLTSLCTLSHVKPLPLERCTSDERQIELVCPSSARKSDFSQESLQTWLSCC